ncbi:MAG TPA: RDD family protein [Terriglobales bacterium]|nr:RDD family protein [Terriglobales bacterium]
MSCLTGGGDSRGTTLRPAHVRPRFYPSGSAPGEPPAGGDDRVLVEAEADDLSEQQFAASLDAPAESRRRFVPASPGSCASSNNSKENARSHAPGKEVTPDENPAACDSDKKSSEAVTAEGPDLQSAPETSPVTSECEVAPAPTVAAPSLNGVMNDDRSEGFLTDGPQWRQEVAARLNNYHSRRTRKPPRYPSLALKFDPPAYSSPPSYAPEPPCTSACAVTSRSEVATATAAAAEEMEEPQLLPADASNIIEFPRPLVPPPPRPDELAEPILDLPRILDAPEAVPKQVPLGGIILQGEEAATPSDLELPLPVAPLGRRVLAAGLDGVMVATATVMFALITNKIAVLLPSARLVLELGVALPAILWAVFEYVFLVYTGSTPGMRLTGLRLSDYDGSVPDRSTRRWRALAMALSAVSLGLGFLWCLLDEDTLCWHDRITRTYLDAGAPAETSPRQGPMFPQRFFACLRRAEAFLQRRDEETSDEAGPLEH